MNRFLKMFFSPDAGAAGNGADTDNGNGSQNAGGNQQGTGNQAGTAAPAIDYDKIQSMIDKGTQQKENAILKSYFQQQGLSEEEARQAMTAYKQQKASQQPDVSAIQTQLAQAQAAAQQAAVDKEATLAAIELGIDAKTIPYVLKLADFSQAMGADGKINPEAVKSALNKVVEDVPALKPQTGQNTGFVQVGASGRQQQTTTTQQSQIAAKRWNRFN